MEGYRVFRLANGSKADTRPINRPANNGEGTEQSKSAFGIEGWAEAMKVKRIFPASRSKTERAQFTGNDDG
jgi:hypothetical protein